MGFRRFRLGSGREIRVVRGRSSFYGFGGFVDIRFIRVVIGLGGVYLRLSCIFVVIVYICEFYVYSCYV